MKRELEKKHGRSNEKDGWNVDWEGSIEWVLRMKHGMNTDK